MKEKNHFAINWMDGVKITKDHFIETHHHVLNRIQENTIIHVDPNTPVTIGNNCTIGHNAIIHGCTIGNNSLVGMGATILNNAKIGNNCLLGANSLVTEGKEFPDNSLIVGSPAKVKRELTDMEKKIIELSAFHYVENMKRYRKKLIEGK